MQIKFTNDKKARAGLALAALALVQLFALRSCSKEPVEFLPLLDPVFRDTDTGFRELAILLAMAIFAAFMIFFLMRVIRFGAKSDKVMLASFSGVALYAMLMLPPELPPIGARPAAASREVIYLEDFCDMSCFDGGGPSLPPMPAPSGPPATGAGV